MNTTFEYDYKRKKLLHNIGGMVKPDRLGVLLKPHAGTRVRLHEIYHLKYGKKSIKRGELTKWIQEEIEAEKYAQKMMGKTDILKMPTVMRILIPNVVEGFSPEDVYLAVLEAYDNLGIKLTEIAKQNLRENLMNWREYLSPWEKMLPPKPSLGPPLPRVLDIRWPGADI